MLRHRVLAQVNIYLDRRVNMKWVAAVVFLMAVIVGYNLHEDWDPGELASGIVRSKSVGVILLILIA